MPVPPIKSTSHTIYREKRRFIFFSYKLIYKLVFFKKLFLYNVKVSFSYFCYNIRSIKVTETFINRKAGINYHF